MLSVHPVAECPEDIHHAVPLSPNCPYPMSTTVCINLLKGFYQALLETELPASVSLFLKDLGPWLFSDTKTRRRLYICRQRRKRLKTQLEVIRTPAQEVIPLHALFLSEHGHHDECVQVDPFTQHPEVVAGHQVVVDKMQNLAAQLSEGNRDTTQ